jgi:hypothetical protein
MADQARRQSRGAGTDYSCRFHKVKSSNAREEKEGAREKVSSQQLAFPTTFGPKPRYNPRHPSLALISHKVRQIPCQIPPSGLGVDTVVRVVNERMIQKLVSR